MGVAELYVAILADTGIAHGLMGPREAPRLWERHVLNCAVVHPLFAPDTEVADIGSGAGLPGLVLAIIRPARQAASRDHSDAVVLRPCARAWHNAGSARALAGSE